MSMTDKWIGKMWYMYRMEYYSAIKKNKMMPFAATWMELEILILSGVVGGERQMPYDVTYIWNLIYGTDELIYRKKNSWTWRAHLWLPSGGEGIGWIGRLGLVDANSCI